MNTFFGTIGFMIANSNKTHIIWCALILLTMLVLAVLHHRWRYYEQELERWKKLCFIPLLMTTVHYFVYTAGAPDFLSNYTPMYLIAVLALVPMLCAERKTGYKVFAAVTGVLAVLFGLYFCTSSVDLHNYTRKSYTKSFHAMVKEMDRSYVLKEWKEIDFAALEEKYMPMVKEAEQEKDPARFADAVTMFCNELHDGHVMVHTDYNRKAYTSVFELHDYGLGMIQLDSGEVIAVCTDEEISKLGIEDGTVITKWNGKPVLQAAEEDVLDEGLPVKANADRLALFDLSATGGETVEVTFIGKSGGEQTAVLSRLENEHTLDDAYNAFSHSPEKFQDILASNLSTKMLDDKCGYLVLTAETTGSVLRDKIGFYSGESTWAREMFRRKLRKLREQGMEYLVIDMRNNIGGYDEVGAALCSLLTDEERFASGLGVRRNGEYVSLSDKWILGDGEFADLKVVALTNLYCISGGDVTAKYLSELPNVTLAGITDPCGSGQMTGGCCAISKGIVTVSYPTGLTLDENGTPNIDTRADQVSRDPVEVRIPLDYDAAMKIFRDKEDYELDWAVKYLEADSQFNIIEKGE